MRDKRNAKPPPARLNAKQASGTAVKPTPARDLVAGEARELAVAGPPAGRASPTTEPDVGEVALEADGALWTVRVLGRAGGSDTRSPPLLLLGFWAGGREAESHREATVVARTLAELTPSRLEDALARSSAPPLQERRKPFFEGAGQGRRGGSSRRES